MTLNETGNPLEDAVHEEMYLQREMGKTEWGGSKMWFERKILTKLADCGPVLTLLYLFAESAMLDEFKTYISDLLPHNQGFLHKFWAL